MEGALQGPGRDGSGSGRGWKAMADIDYVALEEAHDEGSGAIEGGQWLDCEETVDVNVDVVENRVTK